MSEDRPAPPNCARSAAREHQRAQCCRQRPRQPCSVCSLATSRSPTSSPRAKRQPRPVPAQASPSDPLTPCQIPTSSILQQTIFLSRFSRPEIAAVRDGLRVPQRPPRHPDRHPLRALDRAARRPYKRPFAAARPAAACGSRGPDAASRPQPDRPENLQARTDPGSRTARARRSARATDGGTLPALLDERTRPGRRFAHALNQDITSALHHAAGPLAPASGSFELTAALEATLNASADMGAQRVLRCWRRP